MEKIQSGKKSEKKKFDKFDFFLILSFASCSRFLFMPSFKIHELHFYISQLYHLPVLLSFFSLPLRISKVETEINGRKKVLLFFSFSFLEQKIIKE
jgi:hypothetical protein